MMPSTPSNRFTTRLPTVWVNVARRAAWIACRYILNRGSTPGPQQQAVITGLAMLFAESAAGLIDRRVGAGIPCGLGKSTVAGAFAIAVLEHLSEVDSEAIDYRGASQTLYIGYAPLTSPPAPVSLTIAGVKVAGLAALLSDMVAMATMIDTHEGTHLQALVQAHVGIYHRATGKDALNVLSVADPTVPRVLLCSHAGLLNGSADALDRRATFKSPVTGEVYERSLIVWDEAVFPSDALSVDLTECRMALAGVVEGAASSVALTEAGVWAEEVLKRMRRGERKLRRKEGGHRSDVVVVESLPRIDEDRMDRLCRLFQSRPKLKGLVPMVRMSGAKVRISSIPFAAKEAGDDAAMTLATFKPAISDALTRLVCLDGSFSVSALYAADDRIVPWESLRLMQSMADRIDYANLKTYERVTVRWMRKGGGRRSIKADLSNGSGSRVIKDVVDAIQSITNPTEAILVFTFLPAEGDRGRSMKDRLEDALTKAGVDLQATVETPDGPRPRICITAWGSETGSNQFAYVHHVMLPGVYRLPFGEQLGRWLGANDDHAAPYGSEEARRLELSWVADRVYQAASRGRSRSTDELGRALPMTLWLIDRNEELFAELRKVMPQLPEPVEWRGTYAQDGRSTDDKKVNVLFRAVLGHLKTLPESVTSLSTRKLWEALESSGGVPEDLMDEDTKKAASGRFKSVTAGWIRPEGAKSFVRAAPGEEFPEGETFGFQDETAEATT